MTTSWAKSSNADADDEFFSTLDKSDSVWNDEHTFLPEINCNNDNRKNNNYNTETTSIKNIDTNIDTLLAKELNALSFQQRESINEEIHGINFEYLDKGLKEIEETPQLLEASFRKLQIELNTLQPNSFAYNRCQQLYGDDNNGDGDGDGDGDVIAIAVVGSKKKKITYLNTDEFRIIFLRCDLFDVTKAARRIINFVELMYDLYGDIGLQRRIRLDDLSSEELRILKAGCVSQLLPSRDRAGRRILIHIDYNTTHEFTVKSRLRIAYYTQMALADDIETQRKGAVQILWLHNVNIFADFSLRCEVYSAGAKHLPVRTSGVHICVPEELEDKQYLTVPGFTAYRTPANIIKSTVALSIGGKLRSYLRIHTGSVIECVYALQSFGIPYSEIPLVGAFPSQRKRKRKTKTKTKRKSTPNGGKENNSRDLKLDNHNKWLELCQLKERNMTLFDKKWKSYGDNNYQPTIIECLIHSDILSGRGNGVNSHPGNLVLKSIVVSKLDEYIKLKSSVNEITKLTWDVVCLLQNEYGARFLKEETTETNGKLGCWVEVSNKEARLKVRIAFRDKVKLLQKPDKQQQPQQITNQQQQSQLLISPPIQPPTIMMTTTENNNYNTPNNNNRQIQQDQQVDEENASSSTSMFLSMAGGSSGRGRGCDCGSTSSKEKL